MASTLTWLESSGFLPAGTPKNPCVCSSCWQRSGTSPMNCGCLSDYSKLPRHLWTDAAVHDETCRGVHWISWRTFWTLLINELFQLWHKVNASGHMLILTYFLVLVYGTRAQSLSRTFQLHSVYSIRSSGMYMLANMGADRARWGKLRICPPPTI
jgi:hypothetical protein